MIEQIFKDLLKDIQTERVRYGSIDIKLTFHDFRPVNSEVIIQKKKNISSEYEMRKYQGLREGKDSRKSNE